MEKNYTEEEIVLLAQSAIGKTFGELNNMKLVSLTGNNYNKDKENNKAFFGHLLETNVYGYDVNSTSAPDFLDAGIELKVTPYKRNKDNTLSAKERLVLNIINYMEEYKTEFYSSHFWYKNNKIQIIWYFYEPDKNKNDLKITHELLFTFPKEDLPIIIKDWETIIDKIKKGKAHEISEADTMYLGACTKGANKNSVREQPFSPIKAMQRAFCLKTSYMTGLVRKYIGNYEDVEKVLKNTEYSFDSFIDKVVNKYRGKSQKELMEELKIDSNAKNLNGMIIARMFNVKSRLRDTDEFQKANIVPRTIRVEENGHITESMPFPAFNYESFKTTEWEDSELKDELETTKYMFFVFKKKDDDYIFSGIKLWNMPELVLENEVKDVWDKTKNIILSGNIVKSIDNNGKRDTNFPGMSDNRICHVRPHARDSKDTLPLPVADKLTGLTEYTKQCFWLNNKYLEEILRNFL